MRKLRIGVWVNEGYQPTEGGGFGYYSQLLNAIKDYEFKDAEVVFVSFQFSPQWSSIQKTHEIKNDTSFFYTVSRRVINRLATTVNKLLFNPEGGYKSIIKEPLRKKVLDDLSQKVDVLYYLTPGCLIDNFPFIYTLWDLGSLISYSFPEVSLNGEFERRSKHHHSLLHKALMVFCESEAGKHDAINYLRINENRLKVIPIFPSEIISEKCIPERPKLVEGGGYFIHYPAQFWAHKNHYNLLFAFKGALDYFPNLKLILTGSDKGNKSYLHKVMEDLGISRNVIDLGFVSIEELKWLYLNSQGLVMPSFLGPTNMPLLEAAELGCRVACSNLPGHIEQLGEYAYYFNPASPFDMKKAILDMLRNDNAEMNRKYVSKFNIKSALENIDLAFTEIKNIRFSWEVAD